MSAATKGRKILGRTARERAVLAQHLDELRATAAMLLSDLDPLYGGNGSPDSVARAHRVVDGLTDAIEGRVPC